MSGQAAFGAALLDPALPVPPGLTDPQGRPAPRRFAVYRNNVTVSLIEALRTGFPVLERLLGEEFFRDLARAFLRAHPPQSPVLMTYGAAMPGFLEAFPPVADWPYLADVARLELALRAAYHAADAAPLPPEALAIAPEALMGARLSLAPAVRLVASPWPIHAIWRANTEPGAPEPTMRAEEVLVGRPVFDPAPWVLPASGVAFVAALAAGESLGAALEQAGDGFDLAATLQALLAAGALTELSLAEVHR